MKAIHDPSQWKIINVTEEVSDIQCVPISIVSMILDAIFVFTDVRRWDNVT